MSRERNVSAEADFAAGCQAKLERASNLIDEISDAMNDFMGPRPSDGFPPFSIEGSFDETTSEYIFTAHLKEDMPFRLGVLVGDFIHNLRSALDNLVWGLVKHRGGRPTKKTQFPIFSDEEKWDPFIAKNLPKLQAEEIAALESMQPFRVADPEERKGHYLALLAWLSNRDKHRYLHPSVGFLISPAASNPGGFWNPEPEMYFARNNDAGRFEGAEFPEHELGRTPTVIARARITPAGPEPRMILLDSRFAITFTERRLALLDLIYLLNAVRRVLEGLGVRPS
jgi:hypothetical protein